MNRAAPIQAECPFRISQDLIEEMRMHVSQNVGEETCGLVAGSSSEAQAVIRMTNALHSPVRYRIDPKEQLKAFELIEQKGWRLLAIYHSHLHGPAGPSETDINEAYYPEAVYLIWSLLDSQWKLRAFRIQDHQASELSLLA